MNRTAASVRARIEKTTLTQASDLSDAIRVRIGPDLLARLDRIEALARGKGVRAATRSALIRRAIEDYVSGIEEALALPPIGGDDE